MSRSFTAHQDVQDDYVRTLLDQRAARADPHGRFSSPSDFSDTPSVYSRPFFSPRPLDSGSELDFPSEERPFNSQTPLLVRSDRERLNDPSTSSLDLDDDPRSSYATSHTFKNVLPNDDGTDDESMPRMSLLGPKMRFHSRAPWELEGDVIHEDEANDDLGPPTMIKHKTHGTKLLHFGSRSPKFSDSSRPSYESTRSDTVTETSLDVHTSSSFYKQDTVYTHNQGNPSNTSLGKTSIYVPSDARHGRFTPSLTSAESPNTPIPPSPYAPSSICRSPTETHFLTNHSAFDFDHALTDDTHLFHQRPSLSEPLENVHPYANPDLVVFCAQETPPSPVSTHRDITHSGSASIVGEYTTTSSVANCTNNTALKPDTSTAPKSWTSKGREISTPVAIIRNNVKTQWSASTDTPSSYLISGVQKLPGWMEKNSAPSFALISLEEARAQRTRSITQLALPRRPSDISLDGNTIPPRADSEVTRLNRDTFRPPNGNANQRTRARSISTGTKAKAALHSIVGTQSKPDKRDTDLATGSSSHTASLPGKSLKHKKSGLMRLLMGNKTQEREEHAHPPPVPTLPDGFVLHNVQSSAQKSTKLLHRVPVPELPSVLRDEVDRQETLPNDVTSQSNWPIRSRERTPPRSINTVPLGPFLQVPGPASDELQAVPITSPRNPWSSNAPHSAPPNVTEFPILQLRPTSTAFSAHFEEHLTRRDSRPSLEMDVNTPRSSSPGGMVSPVTPGFSTRPSEEKSVLISSDIDSQSALIKALQEHIVSAKLAWQRQVWELEGRVRDLKAEVDDLKAAANEDYCEACGWGPLRHSEESDRTRNEPTSETKTASVVNRPRARTGTSARFGSSIV
ncbi:hypothetical protein AX17_000364 [Amanita inopinata Kibby_2008]|nr:hypothetical protein AX17_000364 [Amanita inopinata Kibby_2008]